MTRRRATPPAGRPAALLRDQRRAWRADPRRADLAIVCFSGRASLPWLRLLAPGFRHCAAVLRFRGAWLTVDPMVHFTYAGLDSDLGLRDRIRLLRAAGYRTVLTRPAPPPRRALPWRPYTCVEAVKRLLGLDAPWALTPRQLHRLLTRRRRAARRRRRALRTVQGPANWATNEAWNRS